MNLLQLTFLVMEKGEGFERVLRSIIPPTSLLEVGSGPFLVFIVYAQHVNSTLGWFLHEKLTTSKTFTNILRVYCQAHDALSGLVVQSMMDISQGKEAMDKGQELLVMRHTLSCNINA